ncbi:RB-associated KRAB zinc finger protein-like [Rhipicephalus sanguineus]|nr:RB-associated KRAB zinc finger protein-like [Rhipicephalus sanguineus]
MPGCCCAPNCRSNYANGPRARVYRFPLEPARNAAWTKAVRRENFTPTKYNVVCEHHFLESDFVDSASYTDSMTGKVIEVPLKLRRLKPSAIPSVFPNCPAYLSRQETSARESPEEKRARLDAEALQKAIRLSEQSHEAEKKKNVMATFEDLLKAVGGLSLTDFWTKVVTQKQVLFLNFSDQGAPVVHRAVTVASDLSLAVYVGEMRLQNLRSAVLPTTISDLRVLHEVLCDVEDVTKDSTNNELELEILLKRVVALLKQLSSSALPHEWSSDKISISQPDTDGKPTATRSLHCGVCNKVFKGRSHLRTHLFAHVGKKRYACDMCGRKYAQKRDLVIHNRTHTGKRPFECSSCPATFINSESRKRHMLTHTGERPHEFNVCGRRFARKSDLASHGLTHSGKKMVACHVCGRNFSRRGNLRRHVRTHTGEKPYACQLCPATFARLSTLKTHVVSHTGERPYTCDKCWKSFSSSCNLSQHKLTQV